MIRGAFTVGLWTMASRILGFVRDILIAAILGTGPIADATFVALRLPNLFRRLFGEGAFNAAFVPAISTILHQDGLEAATDFAEEATAVMMFWLGAMDPAKLAAANAAGESLPAPHNSRFEPIPEPTLRTGVTAMTSVGIALLQ